MPAGTPFSLPWCTMYLTSHVPSGRTSVTFATPPSLLTPGEEREGTLTKSPALNDGVAGHRAAAAAAAGGGGVCDGNGSGGGGVVDDDDAFGGRAKAGER